MFVGCVVGCVWFVFFGGWVVVVLLFWFFEILFEVFVFFVVCVWCWEVIKNSVLIMIDVMFRIDFLIE